MYKRFNELNFVIGLFFSIIAVILLVNNFFIKKDNDILTIYTSVIFLVFGIIMIVIKSKKE